jgi:hypothetical protein
LRALRVDERDFLLKAFLFAQNRKDFLLEKIVELGLLAVLDVELGTWRPGLRGDGASADAARQVRPDSGEPRREAKKFVVVSPFGIGQSRGWPLESSDKLPVVDRPMAKNLTRDRVSWLAAHKSACFLPETGGGHSVAGWMGSVGG